MPKVIGRPAKPCGPARQASAADRAVWWRPGSRASPMVRRGCPHIPAGLTTCPCAPRPDGTRSHAADLPRRAARPRPAVLRRRGAPCAPLSHRPGGRGYGGQSPMRGPQHICDLGLVADSAAHVTPPTVPPGPVPAGHRDPPGRYPPRPAPHRRPRPYCADPRTILYRPGLRTLRATGRDLPTPPRSPSRIRSHGHEVLPPLSRRRPGVGESGAGQRTGMLIRMREVSRRSSGDSRRAPVEELRVACRNGCAVRSPHQARCAPSTAAGG